MKDKFLNWGVWGVAFFHIAVCGIPFAAALLGFALPFLAVPGTVMVGLLILSGGLIAAASLRICKGSCGCNGKGNKWQKINLAAISLWYVVALLGHFLGNSKITDAMPCH
ncbi:MAG: hypothetical protein LBB09_03040 [Rickettsiales bacterium]|jgi:hypothetical protein|nr:hypothetical protein [Rickettsiales bacterium]